MNIVCLRRKRYASFNAAQSVIYGMRAKGNDTHGLTPSKCPLCNGWHLKRVELRVMDSALRAD